ncbi:MAG: glycosyltransferase [Rufibacter sp.]
MFRKRILLASLLKPVSDTRMYGKLGLSLTKLLGADVHIAGFAAALPRQPQERQLTFHPIFSFKRLSWQRFYAQFTYWKLLRSLQPEIVIVGTHELLLISWLYCRFSSCQLVYDVRENYYLNLTTQGVYPVMGKLLAVMVRGIEKLTANRVRHFILAEQTYATELPFIGTRYTVLPNKYLPPASAAPIEIEFPVKLPVHQPLRLIFSGTISKLYGVEEAVTFTEELRHYMPRAELTIIGYCADSAFLKELQGLIAGKPYITMIGGSSLVPHQQILQEEARHHLGLLPYHPHPSTFTCVPTKLYEYQANGLVAIAQENPLWEEILTRAKAGWCFDFSKPITPDFVQHFMNYHYYPQGIPDDVYWQTEEPKLLDIIHSINAGTNFPK